MMSVFAFVCSASNVEAVFVHTIDTAIIGERSEPT